MTTAAGIKTLPTSNVNQRCFGIEGPTVRLPLNSIAWNNGSTLADSNHTNGSFVVGHPSSTLSGLDGFPITPISHEGGDQAWKEESLEQLRFYTYGVLMPAFCILGIFGNVLNLAVLTRPNMKSVSHIYMRGYAVSALLAIAFALPFCARMAFHEEVGQWISYPVAFYHAYLELYVGNAFVGNGVIMMVALTLERYVAICHPTRIRADASYGAQRAYAVVFVVPILCLLIYLPYMFHAMIDDCQSADGQIIYQRRDNLAVQGAIWYHVYQWMLQCIFRLLPVTILGWLNVCIIIAYRKVCLKRKRLTRRPTGEEKSCSSDARRLMFLLGVTSCLFFVCMTPVAILSIVFSTEMYLDSLSFQIFRAVANTLEIVNFAMTFYIYCLFSTEFRQTFLTMIGCPAGAMRGGAMGGAVISGKRPSVRVMLGAPRNPASLAPNPQSFPTLLGSQMVSTPSRETMLVQSGCKTVSEPELTRLLAFSQVKPSTNCLAPCDRVDTSLLSQDLSPSVLSAEHAIIPFGAITIHVDVHG